MALQNARLKLVNENTIRVLHPEEVEPNTFLTATAASGATSITVKSNFGFSNQELLLVEGFGSKLAEIKKVNAAVSAGGTLTTSALTFAHGVDCKVSKVLFDQVEISGSTTATGSKTVIATVNLNVSGLWTDYILLPAATTYAFYHARYGNSLSTTTYNGGYSDAIASTNFTGKTIGFIRRTAFDDLNEELGGKFTLQWVYDKIYQGELNIVKRMKRWSWTKVEDSDLGNLTIGMRRIALPSNIEDNKTNKSILGLRIGNGMNLTYIDKSEYEEVMDSVPYTTLGANIASLDTTVTLTDSRDFPDSGYIRLSNGTPYAYTTNTRSTGVLSGFTAFTTTFTSGDDAWGEVSFGEPLRYTVMDGYAYFDVPPSSDFNGRNIWMDFWKVPTKVDSDGDEITVNDPEALILWLKMQVKSKKLNGELPVNDISIALYEAQVLQLQRNEVSGQKLQLVPAIPNSNRNYRNRGWRW